MKQNNFGTMSGVIAVIIVLAGFVVFAAVSPDSSKLSSPKDKSSPNATLPDDDLSFTKDTIGYERGVLIVKFKQNVGQRLLSLLEQGKSFDKLPFPASIKELNSEYDAYDIEPLFDDAYDIAKNLAQSKKAKPVRIRPIPEKEGWHWANTAFIIYSKYQ